MKKSVKNVLFGLSGQFIILIIGIFLPRLILKQYSDEVNGLVNAISQVFTYLALIEAGIGQATVQALYKPIVEDDKRSVSAIMSATQRYFRKLVIVYAAAVLLFALSYPLIIDTSGFKDVSLLGSPYLTVFLIVLLQGVSNVISFYFVNAYKQLLIADGHNYIISNLTTVSQILVALAKIVLIGIGVNIVVLQLSYLVINVLVAGIYAFLFKRKYSYVDFNEPPNTAALSQRNSFIIHEASSAIFSGTDVILLSVFCDLRVASIYAIYNMVFSAISILLSQLHNSCFYILGQKYNTDREGYVRVHDMYNILYISLTFILISVAYILINPFVGIYTSGVTDMDYVDKYLPFLFCLIQLLSCCRITDSNLVKVAGHAKQTVPRTIIESVINLSVSLIMVQFIGIYGVLLGTVVSLLYRTNDFVIYANLKILKRSVFKQYIKLIPFFAVFAFVVILNSVIDLGIVNYGGFIVWGFILVFVSFAFYAGISLALNRDLRKFIFRFKIKDEN